MEEGHTQRKAALSKRAIKLAMSGLLMCSLKGSLHLYTSAWWHSPCSEPSHPKGYLKKKTCTTHRNPPISAIRLTTEHLKTFEENQWQKEKYQEIERQILEEIEIINLGKKTTSHFSNCFSQGYLIAYCRHGKNRLLYRMSQKVRKYPWKLKW